MPGRICGNMLCMRLTRLLIVLSALAFGLPVWAETVYKSTRADGSVVYSDAPVPGAARVERYELVPLSPEEAARAVQQRAQELRRIDEANERQRQRELAWDRADAEVKAALDDLKGAQQRLRLGVEPLPGERTGIGGGRSRLNEAYYKRMQRLEEEVTQAVNRLDRAYAARNALRD